MLEYRTAQKQDVDYLLWLRKQTMTTYLQQAGIPTTDAFHLQRIQYQFAHAQLILWEGELVGLLKLIKKEGGWEIAQFQIAPNFQGKGIGQQVLKMVLDTAKAKGVLVRLSVLKQNPARRLYEKVGFQHTHEDQHSYYLEFRSGI